MSEIIVYLVDYFNTFPLNCLNSLFRKEKNWNSFEVLGCFMVDSSWMDKGGPDMSLFRMRCKSAADTCITGFGQSWSKFGSCHHILVFRRQYSESKKYLETLLCLHLEKL